MTVAVIGAIIVLAILLIIETPVSISLAASGAVGLIIHRGFGAAESTLAAVPFNVTASYSLAVIPMYILMGALATRAGIAADLFDVANKFLGKQKGGLAVAAIAACAGFAAITGSSVATVASIGRTAILEMRKHGYPDSLSTGAVAAAGTLGILIPPSIILVIYGILTNTSIGALLIAGVIPGIMTAIAYATTAVVIAHRLERKKALAVQAAGRKELSATSMRASSATQVVTGAHYLGVLKVAVLFTIVVGGVFFGWFTATEASGIGALVALFMLLLSRRPLADTRKRTALKKAFEDSASLTSSVFAIMVGAGIFSFFLVSVGAPAAFTRWVSSLPLSPAALVIVFLLILVPMGMVFDSMSILLISVPLLHPTVEALGFNSIWFGILMVKLIEIGLVTPPVGMNVFVISGGIPDIKPETVFKGIIPFIGADVIVVAVLFMMPEIILWLPSFVMN